VPSVAFVSPAHGRLAVTALVLAQRRRLIRELAGRGIDAVSIIVACDDNLKVAAEYGCQTVESPNLPLGEKCNVGLRAAAPQAEFVVWIGADDWIHPDVFDPLLGKPSQRPRIIAGRSMAILNLRTARLQQICSPSKYGAIPWLLDSRLLRSSRTDFVRPDLNRGLDGALMRGLRLTSRLRHGPEFHDPHAFRCVDFKTRENVTPYRGLAKHLGTVPEQNAWRALEGWYDADLVDLARATAAETKHGRRRNMRMTHPGTGESVMVSRAGAEVLRGRGWVGHGKAPVKAASEPKAAEAASDWPGTHAELDALAEELDVTWPPPLAGKKRLTVAEKIAVLEAI
jgi:hypothetical protein